MKWYRQHNADGTPVEGLRPIPEAWARIVAAGLSERGERGFFRRCATPEPRPRTEYPVGSREAVAARMRLRAKFGGRK